MTNPIASDTTSAAKNLAAQIAKQISNEPAEFLRDLKQQTGVESSSSPRPNSPIEDSLPSVSDHAKNSEVDRQKSSRLIEALNRELEDIKKQNLFKELQARIAQGEQIPLHEYPVLSLEQKQVLNAQMEAVKMQRAAAQSEFHEVPAIVSKPSRRFGAGQKQQAQKEQTRVEKPVPPSG